MADTREVEVPPRPRAAQVMEVPILPGLYVRQALDIQWSDLAVSYARTLLPLAQDHAAAVADLEEFWGVEGESEGVCALSVRSFFHALLTYLDLPAGFEVIMSAVTIKDMPRIVRHHGLVPVPVDIDLATLAPRLDLLEAAVSSKSRLLVVAPLFGSRTDVAPYAAFARAHGLLFMEDCAQRFEGEESYAGCPCY